LIEGPPGVTRTATIEDAGDGRLAVMLFALTEDDHTTFVIAPTNVGIVDLSGGAYSREFTLPDTIGRYWVQWTTDIPGEEAEEDVTVLAPQRSERGVPDALRSVRRYIASALGAPPYRVMLTPEPGRFKRPYAIVAAPSGVAEAPGGVDMVQLSMPIVVHVFPLPGERSSVTRILCAYVEQQLHDALAVGMPDALVPSVRGYRQLIPLWNYNDPDTGVGLPLEGEPAISTARGGRDYLRVANGWNVETRPEVSDEKLSVVVAEFRVQWNRPTRLASDGSLLQTVQVQFN
jgi:hypothetical protein